MDRFRHLFTRAVAVAAVLSLAVVVIMVLAQLFVPTGAFRDAVIAVLAAILAVLLVSVVWDVSMRRSWTDELLNVVRLERGLSAAGIREVGQESEVNWPELLTGMQEFHFVVRDLDLWLATRFSQLVSSSGPSKAIHVHLYIPDPTQVDLGHYENLDTARYEQSRTRVDKAWEDAKTASRLNRASKLDKWSLKTAPQFMIVSARQGRTQRVLLVLWPTQGAGPGSPAVSFRFETGPDSASDVADWVEGQLEPLRVEANRVPV